MLSKLLAAVAVLVLPRRSALLLSRSAAAIAGPTLTEDELVVRFELLEQLGIREIDIWVEVTQHSAHDRQQFFSVGPPPFSIGVWH